LSKKDNVLFAKKSWVKYNSIKTESSLTKNLRKSKLKGGIMKGMNQQQCLDFVKKDITVIRDEAIGVIIISPDNKSFELVENENPRLGVLAIIGPAQGFGKEFDKALLAEIGIGSSRPYHKARGINRQINESDLPQRRKWFNLSEEQYNLIAPFVFNFILEKFRQRVDGWKLGPYFDIPTPVNIWWRAQKRLKSFTRWKAMPVGTAFSISKKDKLLLRDIYWAELNLNERLSYALGGLARFINLMLSRLKNVRFKGGKPFEKLGIAHDIEDNIYKIPQPYLREEVLKHLPGHKDNYFFSELQKLFGLSGEESEEQYLAKEAENLPSPEKRLGKIQLRVTTGLDGICQKKKSKRDRDHIVFEVFPPIESEATEESIEDFSQEDKDNLEEYLKNLPEESLDDIPF